MKRIAIGLVAAALAAAGLAFAAGEGAGRAAGPPIEIARPGKCVAPTPEMRRDHMKMLLRQRDLTVHEGLRDPRFSLESCVNCHASRATGSVLGKDGFCSSCHAYAAVKIDCFECHSPMREERVASRP